VLPLRISKYIRYDEQSNGYYYYLTDSEFQGQAFSNLLLSSPVCYEHTSSKKLGDLGVNVSGGVLSDDTCVPVDTVITPSAPMTGTIA
jgi:hypothetical protein